MSHENQIEFPCRQCPEEPDSQRLLGLYGQRQEGLLMQRVKVHGGRIMAPQLRTLALLAEQYTPSYPLHLTTRQDVELHGVRPPDVPDIQRGIAGAGLTTVGACGDTLRNVTVCPGNGVVEGSFDVLPLADAIKAAAESLPFIRKMPRKFKISVCGCGRGCARPWINDLGLVARQDGTFRAIGAGSLGQRPGTGIELYESLCVSEMVPLVVAALRLFDAEGDRAHRSKARLRHLRERIGDAEFRTRLDRQFAEEKRRGTRPVPPLQRVDAGKPLAARLLLPFGDLAPDAARELADAAESADADLRIGLEHDILVYADGQLSLSPRLEATTRGPTIVACPATTWCQRGLADSREVERGIRELLSDSDLSIGISGCPNNCAHAAVADVGLTGRIKTIDGQRTECFRLLAGGGKGLTPDLGVELHPAVPAALLPGLVAGLAGRADEAASAGLTFPEFVRRNRDELSREIEEAMARGGDGPAS